MSWLLPLMLMLLLQLFFINVPQIELLGRMLAEFPSANLAGIAVGNEVISRGDVRERQLLQYITQVTPPPRDGDQAAPCNAASVG
jgi:uncharacterized protein YciW